jgi:hypothetical protein
MEYECVCVDCGWQGSFSDLLNDACEDSDGDLVGTINACPECEGRTEDYEHMDMGDF